jgi:serine/threonine-protein kinase
VTILGALLGSYRVTDELSSGGMGTVFLAHHELLGKPAAVKLLRPELTSRSELVQRFFTEARAASAIRHPGIVDVFDFGYTDDHRAYLVMELLEGETLFDRIAKGPLPELAAARIARGIASALSAAHATGIVHRDLKPDNVFLVPDADLPGGERAKVLDFGIAKLVDPSGAPLGSQHTQTGALVGTPLYMAPEQARAASTIDHRADLYSLGCLLYEMLVGAPPFDATGIGAGEVIAMQLFSEATPPRARRPDVSREIDAIVMRLLQKEPADRYQSAAEVTAALDGVFAASATKQWPAPSLAMPAATPPARRSRNLLPIVAALVTLAVVASGVILFVTQRGDAPASPPPAPPPQPALVREVTPPVIPPAAPPTVVVPIKPPPGKAVTPPTPHKGKPCDGHKGDHTGKCSPIETAPL